MTYEQVQKYFGYPPQAKLGALLGIGQSAVANWKARGFIPRASQLEIQVITNGKLKAAKVR